MKSFASPHQLDPKLSFFLNEACRKLCDWLSRSADNAPLPVSFDFPDVAPRKYGLSYEDLLEDLQIIMDGAYRPSHPGALAHLDPPPLTSSIVGDLICAGINNNLLAEELSPSLSRLERDLCCWICKRFEMPLTSGGVGVSGGTISNLMALVVARHKANLLNDSSAVFFASEDCHVSLVKAVSVMGLQNDSLKKIPTDNQGCMSIEKLKISFEKLSSQNRKCFAVVATAGTTVRGAVDPIDEISSFCKDNGIWLHVDGAIGGVFGLIPSTSDLVNGISLADSITINPQKILGIAKTSSLLLVSDRKRLASTFSTGLPYVEPTSSDDFHGGEIGIQGTRSAEVMKLWLGLRQLGEKGIENLLLESIDRRKYLESKIDLEKFDLISGPLHLLALKPRYFFTSENKKWSISTRNTLLRQNIMLSRPMYKNLYYLKIVLGNPYTSSGELDLIADILNTSIK